MRESTADQQLHEAVQGLGEVGTWEWFPDEQRMIWSHQTFRVFGLDPVSATPGISLLLALTHPDDRDRVSAEIARMGSVDEGHVVDFRIIDRSGSVRHLRGQQVFREYRRGKLMRAGGCILDRSAKRLAEREIHAYVGATEAIKGWGTLGLGPETLLERVAVAFDCIFATMWLPAGPELRPRASWGAGTVSERDLLLLRHRIEFEPPDEVVLAAYSAHAPVAAPPRRASAPLVMGRFAFPALTGDEVLAVCEFQSREPIGLTERMSRTLVAISYELGGFLSHNRSELHESSLTRREVEVLRLASDGQSGPLIAAELGISRSTVKTHFDHIYAKLDVADRASAVAKALRLGLFE